VTRLGDGIGGRGDACDDGNAARCGFERRGNDRRALLAIEIGELSGRPERCEAMDAGVDEVARKSRQHLGLDASGGIDRRHQIGKHTVEFGHF
jgi:hypothetical protein